MRSLALTLCAALVSGCYSHQAIPTAKLEALTAVPGRAPSADLPGADCDGCTVHVDTTTPLILTTRDGAAHRVTPFYFHMSDAQLVAPDYGVLVGRDEIETAEVRDLNLTGTVALIATVALVAAGTFVAIRSTAGEEDLTAE